MVRWVKWLAVVAAAAVLGYLVWANFRLVRGEPATAGPAPQVMVMPVSRGTLMDRVMAPASVGAADLTELLAPFPAPAVQIAVAVGDPVEAGAVLATLNTDELMSDIRKQEAAVLTARAQLEQALLQAELRPMEAQRRLQEAEKRVAAAEAALDKARRDGAAAVEKAQVAVGTAEAALAAARAAVGAAAGDAGLLAARGAAEAALQKLAANPGDPALTQAYEQAAQAYRQQEAEFAAQALAQAQKVTEAETQLAETQAALARAEQQAADQVTAAEEALAQARYDLNKLRLEQSAAAGGTDPVEAARQSLTAAEEALAARRRKLDEATVRSPISGVVLAVQAQSGQAISAGGKLLTVGRLDEMKVQLRVEEADIGQLTVGLPLTLTTPAFPGVTFPGTITDVPLQAGSGSEVYYGPGGGSATFLLTGTVANPEGKLRIGMNTEAEVVTTRRDGVVLIGLEALRQDGGPHVFVWEDGKARRRNVAPGATNRTQVEIRDGLQDGDLIIIGPFPVLKELQDGQEVHAPEAELLRNSRPEAPAPVQRVTGP